MNAGSKRQSAVSTLTSKGTRDIIRPREIISIRSHTKEVAAQSSDCTIPLKFRRAAEITKQRKHRRKDTKPKKELSHRDAFRHCSKGLSWRQVIKETNWKTRIEEKDRFNQQQRT